MRDAVTVRAVERHLDGSYPIAEMQVFDPIYGLESRGQVYWLQLGVHLEEFEGAGLRWGELRVDHEGGVGLAGHRHGVVGDGGEIAEERAEAVDRQSVIGALGQGLAPGGR